MPTALQFRRGTTSQNNSFTGVVGELLDVDGVTGGFNFQHCWTSGWLAGNAIANGIMSLGDDK